MLVENFKPGTLEKWGLGWDDLSKLNPRLVMVRISGFGQDGPYSQRPGYGVVCEAVSGLRHLTGDPDRAPARVGVSMTDYIAGLHGAYGAVMALMARDKTGRGQVIDAALYESAFNFMEVWIGAYEKLGFVPEPHRLAPDRQHAQQSLSDRRRQLHPHHGDGRQPVPPPVRRDGPARAGRRRALRRSTPRATRTTRRSTRSSSAWTKQHTLAELEAKMQAVSVPATRIFTVEDIFNDPHYRARQLDHRGARPASRHASPCRPSCRACPTRRAACAMPAATSARIRAPCCARCSAWTTRASMRSRRKAWSRHEQRHVRRPQRPGRSPWADPEKLARRKAAGVLNARERVEKLLDAGTFIESGLFGASAPADPDRSPADGKIAGFGKIDGRECAVVANDFTVMGASSAATNGRKIGHMKRVATSRGLPMVFLGESSGARMPDHMGARGMGTLLGNDGTQYIRMRETPWASATLGLSYGSSSWYSVLSDFNVVRKGAVLAVSSAQLASLAIKENVDPEEMGGWQVHAEVTGFADAVADTDEEALELIRTFLSYLPSHHNRRRRSSQCRPGSGAQMAGIAKLLPEKRTQVYDVRRIVRAIVDDGSFFELKARFGKVLTTGLARLGGRTVGIVANNPLFRGGAMDTDACEKGT